MAQANTQMEKKKKQSFLFKNNIQGLKLNKTHKMFYLFPQTILLLANFLVSRDENLILMKRMNWHRKLNEKRKIDDSKENKDSEKKKCAIETCVENVCCHRKGEKRALP